MKKLIILAICLLAASTRVSAQGEAMNFDHSKWDFGTIKEQDGRVSHTFTFTNRSQRPVVMEHVEVSCGCTTADFSRKPVMAGEKGQVTIVFDPADRPGPFNKVIVITANNRSMQATLSVEGTVVERQRTVEELYPVASASGVRLTMRMLNFRYVAQGEARTMVIGWANPTNKELKFEVLAASGATPYLKINAPKTLCAGCQGQVNITYDLTGQKEAYGAFSDQLWIVADGVRDKVPVSVTAYGVDAFSSQDKDPEKAPRARLDRQYHDFGDLKPSDKPLTVEFGLTDVGASPLVVRYVSAGKGLQTTLKAGVKIEPAQEHVFKVTIDPGACPKGVVNESVVIIVNDPLRPMREVRVAATIR